MTHALFLDDDDERMHAESIDLAITIEQEIQGTAASTVLFALCWVLASLILQGENQKHVAPKESIRLIANQLATCVERLRELAPSSRTH